VQALNDDQHIAAVEAKVDRLERKVDDGFGRLERKIEESTREMRTEVLSARSDARSDFRTLITVCISLWAATVLTVLAAHL
jgi:hypothetical protein